MSFSYRNNFQAHPFHLVSPSPWPIFNAISLFTLTTIGVMSMHLFYNMKYIFCGLLIAIYLKIISRILTIENPLTTLVIVSILGFIMGYLLFTIL